MKKRKEEKLQRERERRGQKGERRQKATGKEVGALGERATGSTRAGVDVV